MTDEDRFLAWQFSQEATKDASAKGRDPFLMVCELVVLMAPDEIRQWVENRKPKTQH